MKKITIILALLILNSVYFKLNAQNTQTDSLENLLQKHRKKDTIRVNLLNETASEFRKTDLDKSLQYAQEAQELAENLSYKKGFAESFRIIGICHYYKKDYPKALEYYQMSLEIEQELNNKSKISVCYRNIAIVYHSQGDYPKALEYYQKSLKMNLELDNKKGVSSKYNSLGEIYKLQGNYPKALEYYQKSLKIDQELENKSGISSAYNNIGIVYYAQQNYPKALEYYQKSLRIEQELKSKRGISSAYNNIGIVYYSQRNYPKALEYYKKSLKIDEEIGGKKGIAISCDNIGLIYKVQGEYPKALEYYQKSLKINLELDDKKDVSSNYNSIGVIYYYQNDYHKTMEYYKKSLEIEEELGDKKAISIRYANIGELHSNRGDYVKASECFQKSLKLKDEAGDENGKTWCYIAIGTNYRAQGAFQDARDYYQKSLKLSIEFGLKSFEVETYVEIGDLYLKQNKIQLAYNYGKKAYILAEGMGHSEFIKRSSEILAKSSGVLGLYKEAYKYHVVFKTMTDSIYNENNVKEITNLENQYKFDKEKEVIATEQAKKDAVQLAEMRRQKQLRNIFIGGAVIFLLLTIIILRNLLQKRRANSLLYEQKEEILSQAEELKITNDKLIELDQFKEGMTGMIVHDLKNPLNSIINASQNISAEKQNTNMKQSGKQMLNMVLNILDVHKYENTQMTVDKIEHSLFEISKNAISNVFFLAEQKNIIINNKIALGTGVKCDKEIIERVFVNIMTNAIKYTPVNGIITLEINNNSEMDTLAYTNIKITDSGQGIPQGQIHRVFNKFAQVSAKSSGKIRSTGLGLTFCKLAVEAHGGNIGVESNEGKGAAFWFTLQSAELKMTNNIAIDTSAQLQTPELSLNADDKKTLEPFVLQFRNIEFYEMSELRKLLKQIEVIESENIKIWIEEIRKAIMSGNEDRYMELINDLLKK